MSVISEESTLIALVLSDFEDDQSSSSASTPTKEAPDEPPRKRLSSDQEPISEKLEAMLSLTQTFSFMDDDRKTSGETFDETYLTDDESYDENSLQTWGTEEERVGGDEVDQHGLVACGENITDASNVFMEALSDTTRVLSLAMKHGANAKAKLQGKFFKTKEEREHAKEERRRQLEEERRLERKEQLREEMRSARDEVGMQVANLWREK